jgi:hypothetical protein
LKEQWFLGVLAWKQFLAPGDVADQVFSIPVKNVSTGITQLVRLPPNLPSDRLISNKRQAKNPTVAQWACCFVFYLIDGTK